MISTATPTIPELLHRNAQNHGEKVAFSSPGRAVTHHELMESTGSIACGLKNTGVGRGHYVIVLLDRCVEAVESILATTRAGAIAVPLDPRCSQAELTTILDDICVEPRWVITNSTGAEQVRGIPGNRKTRVWTIDKTPTALDTFSLHELDPTKDSHPPNDLAPADKAFLFYTSGSTGSKPKGVFSSQQAWIQSTLYSLMAGPNIFPDDKILCPLSVTHAFGFSSGICVVLCTGASLHMTGQTSLCEAFADHAYTITIGVPTTYSELISLEIPTSRLSSIRLCISGGAAASPALNRQVEEKLGLSILNHYGCTETCGIVTVCQFGAPYIDGSCGKLVPGRELRIVEPSTGEDVISGDEGEIWTRSSSLLIEYHNDPTPPLIDGWYRSGDMGLCDDQGNLFITGRLKETIVRGGENIHPAEIECVLNDCHGVRESVVVARAHDVFGEISIAYVVPDHTTPLSMANLITACRKALPSHKVPVDFFQVDAIPRTRSGKPRRRAAASCPHRRLVVETYTVATIEDIVLAEFLHARGLPSNTTVDPTTQFGDMGMNSLVGIVIRDRLVSMTGLALPITLLFDHPTPRRLAEHVYGQLSGKPSTESSTTSRSTPLSTPSTPELSKVNEPIAIVSMACRYPGGIASPEDLWRVVEAGIDVTSDFPTDRGWDLDALYNPDPEAQGATTTRRGGFLHDMADFDAGLFGMSPRETQTTDPQQRLLLESTWTLLERAQLPPLSLRGSDTGVYVGVMYSDYAGRFTNVKHEHEGQLGLGSAPSVAAGRISHFFDLHGPSLAVDTACSSSLVAIDQAAKSVRTGECSLAIAGGVTVMSTPQSFVMFSKQRGLSPDGHCRSYSDDANGTAWSEGVGLLLLERLSDAERKGHQILGLIRGIATNSDGRSSTLTSPSGPQQEQVIQAALRNSGLSPAEIDVIEGHGTATPLGDPIEVRTLTATYGQNRPEPALLGSLKSNLGHTQAAAGVAGIIKTVMAMRKGIVPATLHVTKPSRHIDWEKANMELVMKAQAWPKSERPRRAAVSAFGIGGTNAHVILEQGGLAENDVTDIEKSTKNQVAKLCPWLFSGADHAALQAQASMALDLRQLDPTDVAYSLATTRSLLRWRAAVPPGDMEALEALAQGSPHPRLVTGQATAPRLVVMFSGQGGQFVEMFQELCAAFPIFKDKLNAVCDAINVYLQEPLLETLQAYPGIIDRTDIAQVAIFTFQVSLHRTLEHLGMVPKYLVGYSIGEITAAHVSGILTLHDAAKMVVTRGRLMNTVEPGAMASIEASEAEVQRSLANLKSTQDEVPVIASVNSAKAVVISGTHAAVALVENDFRAQARRTKRLRISHACHSPAVESILPDYLDFLKTISYQKPQIPIISTVTGILAKSLDLNTPEYWTRQLISSVRFADTMHTTQELGGSLFLEIGPSAALAGHVPDAVPTGAKAKSLIEALTSLTIQGCDVAGSKVFEGSGARKVELPTYPFQRRRYWLDPPRLSARDGVEGGAFLEAGAPLPGSGQTVFSGRVSLKKYLWLKDHVMSGKTILPATAFAEMALKAGRELGLDVLAELTLLKPVDLSAGGEVRLQMIVEETGTSDKRNFNIFSRPASASVSQAWVLHASGVLQEGTSQRNDGVSGPSWPTQDELNITEAYDILDSSGISYGPAFRCVQRLWQTRDGFVARLVLPHDCEPRHHLVHPVVLDAALHSPLLATPSSVAAQLPFRLTDVRLWPSKERELRAIVQILKKDQLAIRVYGLRGHLVAEIETVSLRAMVRRSGELFTLQWTPIPKPHLSGKNRGQNDRILRVHAQAPGVEAVYLSVNDILAVIQDWNSSPDSHRDRRLVIITERATTVDPNLASAAVWGFARSAQSESGDGIALIDVDGTEASEGAVQSAIECDEIVLSVREGSITTPRLVKDVETQHDRSFSFDGTVLITGGTGALGSVLCRHLIDKHGVKNLILTSRTGLPPASLTDLATAEGVTITTKPCDVADYNQLKTLLDSIHPPVTAVFHCAGVLDDSLLSSLTSSRITNVLRPKVNGAWNLHNLLPNARPFVLFSSAAGVLGNPGQANYAAANTYLDALARHRVNRGLHAVSLAWGPWNNAAGMAGGITEFGSLLPMSDEQGIELLDVALRSKREVVVPLLVKDKVPEVSRLTSSAPSSQTKIVRTARLEGQSIAERLTELEELIRIEVANALGYDKLPDLPFSEIGLDSLSGVMIRNKVTQLTGVALPSSVMFEVDNVKELAEIILRKLDETQIPENGGKAINGIHDDDDKGVTQELDPDNKLSLTPLFRKLCRSRHYTEALGLLTIASLTLPTSPVSSAQPHPPTLRHLRTTTNPLATLICLPDFLPPTTPTSIFTHLTTFLPNEINIYDITYPKSPPLPPTLPTLTALLAQTLHTTLPPPQTQPIILLGYSAGGLIAHSLAKLLRAPLILLDTLPLTENVPNWLAALPAERILEAGGLYNDEDLATVGHYMRITQGYVVERLEAPTLFVRAGEPMGGMEREEWQARWPEGGEVEVVVVEGSHVELLRGCAEGTAGEIARWIGEM